jgi:preprotein translocase SecE subunit
MLYSESNPPSADLKNLIQNIMFKRLIAFFSESKKELKRVNWPTARETLHLTGIVIGMSIAVAIFLGVLDFLFVYVIRTII